MLAFLSLNVVEAKKKYKKGNSSLSRIKPSIRNEIALFSYFCKKDIKKDTKKEDMEDIVEGMEDIVEGMEDMEEDTEEDTEKTKQTTTSPLLIIYWIQYPDFIPHVELV